MPPGPLWRWLLFFFSPAGRVGRSAYWIQKLVMFVLVANMWLFDVVLNYLVSPLLLAMIWSFFAIEIKRWHDLGRPGTWVLVDLVPVLGPIYSFILLGFAEGNPDENPYGRPPAGIP